MSQKLEEKTARKPGKAGQKVEKWAQKWGENRTACLDGTSGFETPSSPPVPCQPSFCDSVLGIGPFFVSKSGPHPV